MTPTTPSPAHLESIAGLIRRCVQLCVNADSAVANLSAQKEEFLAQSLGDTLQQLELILRVLGEETQGPARAEERKGFLTRLFAPDGRTPSADGNEDLGPPRFDVSGQGLHGNSWTISLVELLGFLAFGRKTGVLWVDGPTENFMLGLVDGNLMHATSSRTPPGLRLGEVLVSLGHMTRAQLADFLAKNKGEAETIAGEALLLSGTIDDGALHAALVYQVEQLFFRLVSTKNAVFRFREGMRVMVAYQVDLDVNHLLLESARQLDELGSDRPPAESADQEWRALQEELSAEIAKLADSAQEAPCEPSALPPSEGSSGRLRLRQGFGEAYDPHGR